MSKRPFTTLFLLVSVDGKISTGDTDVMDVDSDYPNIDGVKEGLKQYYDLESSTDLFSFNSGRVFAKIGVNDITDEPNSTPVSYVVVDNKPHLTEQGVDYLAKKSKNLVVATTNKCHPARDLADATGNVHVVEYDKQVDFEDLFSKISRDFGAERMTVQSGGTLNSILIRKKLIDRVLIVVAPALVGGRHTSTLMDGESLHSPDELGEISSLELVEARPLENSYLLLDYRVTR
jgi:2,5-diamino-6-(ribosylamino)-4(3H)-pyrimidinone 5'-phosphate reductase